MIENIATNNMGDGFVNGEDVWGEISEDCAAMLDIVGYNYLPKRYTADAKNIRTESSAPVKHMPIIRMIIIRR